MNGFAILLSGDALEGALAIFFLSVLGSGLFMGLFLCSRRFDVDPGADPEDGDGGSGGDPSPGNPNAPLASIEPPLGEIRASRARSHGSRRAPVKSG